MKKPWAVAPFNNLRLVEPERWLLEPGAWDEVEAIIGTRLPGDYKDLIGDGLACIFAKELAIASPFDPNPDLNLIRLAARSAWALACLRHDDPDSYFVAVYPESGGLLAWGADGGGGTYHWDTSDPDPDRWVVCIEGRPLGTALSAMASGWARTLTRLAVAPSKPPPCRDGRGRKRRYRADSLGVARPV